MLLGKKTTEAGNLDPNEDMYEDFNYRCEVEVGPDEKAESYGMAKSHAVVGLLPAPPYTHGLF